MTDNFTLEVEEKNVYGSNRTYAKDPVQAKAITKLTGALTLRAGDIEALKALGFKVVLATTGCAL